MLLVWRIFIGVQLQQYDDCWYYSFVYYILMVLTTICCLLLLRNPLIDVQYFEGSGNKNFLRENQSTEVRIEVCLVASVCPGRLWIYWSGEIQIEINAKIFCGCACLYRTICPTHHCWRLGASYSVICHVASLVFLETLVTIHRGPWLFMG